MSAIEETVALILAAGQGTRMKSSLPKVLHPICGRPMISYPIAAALEAGVSRAVVVLGHGKETVEAALAERPDPRIETVLQAEQKGTGHAVECALPALEGHEGKVLILYGDGPLIRPSTLERLVEASTGTDLALLTTRHAPPDGYGRILRDDAGRVVGIREQKDCTKKEAEIEEVNPGVYAISAAFLRRTSSALGSDNAQGEIYLTDLVAEAAAAGRVADVPVAFEEVQGVNDRFELAKVGEAMRARILEGLARSGVTLESPTDTFVDADCAVERDAFLAAGVHLRGRTRIGEGARVDVGAVLEDVEVGPLSVVLPYTVASKSVIGARAQVGPFTHLRQKTELGEESKVGNFSETKKTRIGKGSKVNHLSYVGDGEIGEGVNIGAGTIFCNYDGFQKHTTVLEDGVFIGSDSQLVAPIRVGKDAYVASGTTVTKDVPADALAIARAPQKNLEGYGRRLRERLEAQKKVTDSK